MKYVAILIALIIYQSCGKAADAITVQSLTAPDGTQCYAIMQDGEVKAGSCR